MIPLICERLPWWLSGKESACNAGDLGSIPRLERSPGEGNGNSLQYSCLGNPTDRGACWAIAHGVARVRHNSPTKHRQHQLYENKQNIHMYAFMCGFFKKGLKIYKLLMRLFIWEEKEREEGLLFFKLYLMC